MQFIYLFVPLGCQLKCGVPREKFKWHVYLPELSGKALYLEVIFKLKIKTYFQTLKAMMFHFKVFKLL